MTAEQVIQGRLVSPADVGLIRGLLCRHEGWNRSRLSRELCLRWDWRNGKGQLKDMACRSLLLKLEARGLIQLPPRQHPGRPNARGFAPMVEMVHDTAPIQEALERLRPLRIEVLGPGDGRLGLFKFLLRRYHYLGHRTCVGENLKLMVADARGRLLACLLFGAAAWKAASRDGFIGWSPQARQRNLGLLANNTRFLILPWVEVPHLASHVLGRVCRLISKLWIEHYGHPIHLLETFVHRGRFRGACYRAAGWVHVGATAGRGRNDVRAAGGVAIKEIFLRPLNADFRGRLSA